MFIFTVDPSKIQPEPQTQSLVLSAMHRQEFHSCAC